MSADTILELKDIHTSFDTEKGRLEVLSGISFHLKKGETLGIVGESACGKSVTAHSIMQLLPRPSGRIDSGQVLLRGKDLLKLGISDLKKIRGNELAMIFQDAMSSLNPVHKIGKQLMECFSIHKPEMTKLELRAASLEILSEVGISEADKILDEYPHQLSGGMRQRVMIAMALSCKPDVLIADEPTTALDVTIQAQIIHLIAELQKEKGTAVIFITHDLGVVAQICDRVAVMYCGQVIEEAPVEELFKKPSHPYTKGLLNSIPRIDSPHKQPLPLIKGMVPAVEDRPAACRFANRCSYVSDRCNEKSIDFEEISPSHRVRCLKWRELK